MISQRDHLLTRHGANDSVDSGLPLAELTVHRIDSFGGTGARSHLRLFWAQPPLSGSILGLRDLRSKGGC